MRGGDRGGDGGHGQRDGDRDGDRRQRDGRLGAHAELDGEALPRQPAQHDADRRSDGEAVIMRPRTPSAVDVGRVARVVVVMRP
jgi:hypothetical protein